MKEKDINEYEIGNHCFGDILRINGIDYDELNREEVIEFINEMLINDINKENLLKELLEITLNYLQFDCVENNYYKCEQCFNYNDYSKFERIKDIKEND